MITLDYFTYSRQQWNDISAVVHDELDADQIERHGRQDGAGPSTCGERAPRECQTPSYKAR